MVWLHALKNNLFVSSAQSHSTVLETPTCSRIAWRCQWVQLATGQCLGKKFIQVNDSEPNHSKDLLTDSLRGFICAPWSVKSRFPMLNQYRRWIVIEVLHILTTSLLWSPPELVNSPPDIVGDWDPWKRCELVTEGQTVDVELAQSDRAEFYLRTAIVKNFTFHLSKSAAGCSWNARAWRQALNIIYKLQEAVTWEISYDSTMAPWGKSFASTRAGVRQYLGLQIGCSDQCLFDACLLQCRHISSAIIIV